MQNDSMKVIKEIKKDGRTFLLLLDNMGKYWGIEDKYICNGKLAKKFNGLSGLRSDTREECITKITNEIKIDKVIRTYDVEPRVAILMVVMDMPLEDALKAVTIINEDLRGVNDAS